MHVIHSIHVLACTLYIIYFTQIDQSKVQCAYAIKDEEGKQKEVQEFLEFIAHQLKLNIDGSKSV